MPKLSAASGLDVVTMFHPARPSLIQSSDANLRATWYGCSKVVEAVAIGLDLRQRDDLPRAGAAELVAGGDGPRHGIAVDLVGVVGDGTHHRPAGLLDEFVVSVP